MTVLKDILKNIPMWLGITTPKWMHEAIARRNLPIVAVGAILASLFSAMLAFSLLTGTHSPIDGFDKAVRANDGVMFRYTVTSVTVTVLLLLIAVFCILYLRNKWTRTGLATIVTMLFAFLVTMIWGIAESGNTADRQLLIFASIQFLVAGLIVFNPIASLAFFAGTFFIFGEALSLSGMMSDIIAKDLAYLAGLDIIVCWVVYGLFARATRRERSVVKQSHRDELTGAKNRHCLRDDFSAFIGTDIFVMLCDIDDFKHFNDDYDHDVGDFLLKQFYFALREAFGDECVYRYGGDEFLVVSVEFGEAEFDRKLQKVTEQLNAVSLNGSHIDITYSGGCVHGTATDNAAFRTMLHTADERLIRAKRTGKNRVLSE